MRNWVKNTITKLKSIPLQTWVRTVVQRFKRDPQPDNSPKLLPLYPTSQVSDHEIYVQALNKALQDEGIHNIALTGSYGSGKSSILKDFMADKKDRSILISFSTLGASIEEYTTDPETSSDNKLDSKANLIQKEIVKQILYREKYDNIPASRYPKISKVNFQKTLYWALALTVALPVVSYAFGMLDINSYTATRGATIMALSFLGFFVILSFVFSTLKRVRLEKLSGGPVSIALSSSNNYFDQYLDEIVYFFEATEYDLVILEDIDRFNDLYIFENLRQLNNLLNNSKQVGKQIKFVYAVRDSMFNTEHGIGDGNRTKFFDLMIPTVPFITYKNSRDVMANLFTPEFAIDRSLIAIVSRYITDMRLVKNIYNEFKIFNEKIIQNGKIPELSASNLLASIVFKNVYLQDFEELKDRGSKLDKIYDASSNFIQQTYKKLGDEVAKLQRDITSFNAVSTRSRVYGLRLIAHMQKLMDDNAAYFTSFAVDGSSYSRSDEMLEQDFWLALAKLDAEGVISVSYQLKNSYNTRSLTISKVEVETIIGGKLNTDTWFKEDIEPLKARLAEKEKAMSSIRGKSIKDLMHDHPEFYDEIHGITGGGLLQELVAAGYIDANYALYTSIYREENVSANGMNFIVHNVQGNKQDLSYKFESDQEIKSVLDELDSIYFENRNILNFDILNYLLKAEDSRIESIIKMISSGTADDVDFLNKFFENDNESDLLITALTKKWPGIFNYLVANESISQNTKNHLIDLALLNGDMSVGYKTSHDVSDYLSRNANKLENLVGSSSKKYTETASKLLAHFNVELLSLDGIKNKQLLEFIEANNLYEINIANLELLTGQKNLSLTNIKNLKPKVFEYVSEHLDQYIAVLDASTQTEYSVETPESLVEVLKTGSTQTVDILDMIIEASSGDCYVGDLNDVDPKSWASLIKHNRVTNILPNIIDYYNSKDKQIDKILSDYLSEVESLTENELIDDQSEKKAFALSVLNSDINQETKANIVGDLGLDDYIKPGEFKGHTGNLYGLLVAKDIIEDTATTYNTLKNLTWNTKEAYIANSSDFDSYLADVVFSSDDLNAMSKSQSVKASVKKYVLDNIAVYKEQITQSSATHFAEYALSNNYALSATNLSVILDGPGEQTSVKLLHLSLDQLTKENLLALLPNIGPDYAKLTQTSKRPSFDYNDDTLALVARLQQLGIVSTYDEKKGKLRANTKASF